MVWPPIAPHGNLEIKNRREEIAVNSLLLRKVVFPIYHKLRETKLIEIINELEENQWKTKGELTHLQVLKLKSLLIHAYEKVPFYRQRFDNLSTDVIHLHHPEHFSQIPLLTKQDINENRGIMIAKGENDNKLLPYSTSGSTGEALYFYYDMRSWAYRRATVRRNQEWLGIRLGDRSACLWGSPMDLNKAARVRGRLHGWVNNIMFLSSYELSDERLEDYRRRLDKFRPKLLISYPGPLAVLAEYLLRKNENITSVKAIISSAETLFPWQRDLIEKAFLCPVYNRYGCREFGDIAQECKKREGLHVNVDRFVVEVLDAALNPVGDGRSGQLVITDLDNYGMPFIRYQIGDMASFKKEPCSCGRTLPLLKQVDGRTLDVIRAPNGNRLGGTFWTILFKSRPGIKQFQVIQDTLEQITIRYVRDVKVVNIDFQAFERRINEKCGGNFVVNFKEVEDIPKTSSGKSRFIISKLAAEIENSLCD
jgi:phenylacetate-CoA ligase